MKTRSLSSAAAAALTGVLLLSGPARARQPAESYVFPTMQSCQEDLARLRRFAFQVWHYRLGEYLERLSANPEPRDDTERADLWRAYTQTVQARRSWMLLRDVASCDNTAATRRKH
jgi:hypothetical protein